jgi:acyl-CoA thioester hydrolase
VKPFCWTARVYWEDTDGGGIVYYANYLKYLERARTEWLRSHGFSQQRLAREPGIVFTVVNLTVDYKRPARLDDELLITCDASAVRAASIRFSQRVYLGTAGDDNLLVTADVRVGCLDAQTMRPTRMPDLLIDALGRPVDTTDPGARAAKVTPFAAGPKLMSEEAPQATSSIMK